MSVQTVAEGAWARSLRTRIVPAIAIMMFMMVLVVSILTTPASAAGDDSSQEAADGDPVIMYVFLALAVLCFIGYLYADETILIYGMFVFAALAVVTYYVHI